MRPAIGSVLALVSTICFFVPGDAAGLDARFASVALVRLSAAKAAHCERSALLRPACPHLVPRVGWYLSSLSVDLAGPKEILDVFNLEHGGEYPASPRRNRPPRMAHVVLAGGRVDRLTSFTQPVGAHGKPLRDGLLRIDRREPISLGRVRWGRRSGNLYLAPAFPTGGMLGNHLVFRWKEGGTAYSLSLHGWEPLRETAATLRAMVRALPNPAEAARLARLSYLGHLRLPRGRATGRLRLVAPSPSEHAFSIRLYVAPWRSDVGARIETGADRTIDVFTSSGQRPPCKVWNGRSICDRSWPRLKKARGGSWTILLTKRSQAAANVRVELVFR